MTLAHVVEIVTPKKFLLSGLWFGPAKPKRVVILVRKQKVKEMYIAGHSIGCQKSIYWAA